MTTPFFQLTGVNTKCFPIPYDEEIDPDFEKVKALAPWSKLAQAQVTPMRDVMRPGSEAVFDSHMAEQARHFEMIDLSKEAPPPHDATELKERQASVIYLWHVLRSARLPVDHGFYVIKGRNGTYNPPLLRVFKEGTTEAMRAAKDLKEAQEQERAKKDEKAIAENAVLERVIKGEAAVDPNKRLEMLEEKAPPSPPPKPVEKPLITRIFDKFSHRQQQQAQPYDNEGL